MSASDALFAPATVPTERLFFAILGASFSVFTVLMAGFDVAFRERSLWLALLKGAVFGLFMAVVLTWFHACSARGRLRSGVVLAVRQSSSIHVRKSLSESLAAAERVLVRLGARRVDAMPGGFSARTGMSCRSFGEQVDVTVLPSPGGEAAIRVSSRPSFHFTLVDYGKNFENVERLVAGIRQELSV